MTEKPEVFTVNANGFTVHTDAFAIDTNRDAIYFISLQGPATGVKAVFAAMVNNPPQPIQLVKETKELTNQMVFSCYIPRETMGTWTSKMQKLPLSGAHHLMAYTKLCEPQWQPEKNQKFNKRFVVITPDGQDKKKLYYQHLDQVMDIPLHPSWTDWLWQNGLDNRTTRELTTLGLASADLAYPQEATLRRDIKSAIETGALRTEQDTN